ncbi:hypothetical protein MKP07_13965 [Niabella hibiscisoli]|nr:hypothetical protein [Niabella hibiscisoli]MCH5717232.1 hypothetical protein [Niabella hibiscisoli]
MAGVGTFVMRNKEVLGILRPYNNIIIFQRIRYDQEIRKTSDLTIPKRVVKPAELKMAVTLIEQLSEKFDISAYKNTYSEKLMKVIEAKAKGKKVATPKLRVAHVKTKDLMEQLKASLSAKRRHLKLWQHSVAIRRKEILALRKSLRAD